MVRYIEWRIYKRHERPDINPWQGAKRWSAQFLKFESFRFWFGEIGAGYVYQLVKLYTLF